MLCPNFTAQPTETITATEATDMDTEYQHKLLDTLTYYSIWTLTLTTLPMIPCMSQMKYLVILTHLRYIQFTHFCSLPVLKVLTCTWTLRNNGLPTLCETKDKPFDLVFVCQVFNIACFLFVIFWPVVMELLPLNRMQERQNNFACFLFGLVFTASESLIKDQ